MQRFMECLRSVEWRRVLKVAAVIAAVVGIVIATAYLSNWVNGAHTANERLLQEHQAQLQAKLDELQAQSDVLEGELLVLYDQLDQLEEEVRLSIEARKEAHDEVDNAGSIYAIDAVLKRGIRGASGRRSR